MQLILNFYCKKTSQKVGYAHIKFTYDPLTQSQGAEITYQLPPGASSGFTKFHSKQNGDYFVFMRAKNVNQFVRAYTKLLSQLYNCEIVMTKRTNLPRLPKKQKIISQPHR